MPEITIEQATYLRPAEMLPRLHARSRGFQDAWIPEVERLVLGFGDRLTGIPCPAAIFAQPLGRDHVAVIQIADQPSNSGPPGLGFHVLVISKAAYRQCGGDPFALADRFPPPWRDTVPDLPFLTVSAEGFSPRTVADIRKVLKRIKAGALREDEDPETAELTLANAESPALLGGAQVLVDGGKVVFVRRAPDPGLIRGLWTLLPNRTRSELWPATFAYSNALRFDAVVVPRPGIEDFTKYTTEEQAADYPAGRYELNLQTAAESGDQAGLDVLLGRRSSRETMRLAIVMVVVLSIALLMLRSWGPTTTPPPPFDLSPLQREKAAISAAIVGNGSPWTAVAIHEMGRYRQAERPAAAAAIIANKNPFAAAVQARAAHVRYVEIWAGPK
jgi:hypothetical protein